MTAILEVQVAAGHDNAGGLKALAELAPPLFAAYALGVLTHWTSEDAVRVSAARRGRRVGRPAAQLTFTVLSEAEAEALDDLAGDVTLNVRNKQGGDWVTYNGVMAVVPWGAFDQRKGKFLEVKVDVTGLVEVV